MVHECHVQLRFPCICSVLRCTYNATAYRRLGDTEMEIPVFFHSSEGGARIDLNGMERARTPWMTAIGIMNIVIGTIVLVLVGVIMSGWLGLSRAMQTIDSSLEAAGNRQFFAEQVSQLAGQAEIEFQLAYSYFLPDGLVSGGLALALIVLGIGTLRLSRWARTLSIVWSIICLAWCVFISLLEPVDFEALGMLLLLYPITLLYLFNTSHWKIVFGQAR